MTEYKEIFGGIDENGQLKNNVVKNPYKRVSPMETNCLMKAAMVTVGGGAMGFVMAMFMNAMEFRDAELIGNVRQSTRKALRKDFKRMLSMSRSFAVFGCFFSLFECQLEKLRLRDDSINSFYAGALTSMIISINSMGPKGLLGTGFVGGLFGMVMYKFNFLFM